MERASDYAYLKRRIQSKPAPSSSSASSVPSAPSAPIVVEKDLNVYIVTFEKAREAEKNIGVGDPTICGTCGVVLNSDSRILTKSSYEAQYFLEKTSEKKIEALELSALDSAWVCEFCGKHNRIRIEKEEIPKTGDFVYMLESAIQKAPTGMTMMEEQEGSTVVFCIDNSGSMNTTQQVKGKVNLKHGISAEELEMLKQFMEPGDELQLHHIQGQNNANTFVSRKQCVMAAIQSQLLQIAKNDVRRKVGLITFNNEVVVFGDCMSHPTVSIVGDKLFKREAISSDVAPLKVSAPIVESSEKLLASFNKIEAKGATALGPAVVAAIQLAGKGKPGSSVVICTDGLANIGLGSLDPPTEETKLFYDTLATQAKDKNLNISIVTIKGEGCKMEVLSTLAKATNGNVEIVSPDELGNNFANILQDEVVGLDVNVRIRLHKSLSFRNELPENLKENGSILEKNLVNATVNTKISFEYELKSDQELQAMGINPENIKVLPFQAQIRYTTISGHRFLRVITSVAQATTNKAQMQKNIKVGVVHARVAQQSAALAMSESPMAIQYNKGWMEYLDKNVENIAEVERQDHHNFRMENVKMQKAVKHKAVKVAMKKKKQQHQTEEYQQLRKELAHSDVDSDEDERVFTKFQNAKAYRKK